MKKLFILTISILLLLGTVTIAEAQCKFKSIKKFNKYAKSEDCNITVDVSTKFKPIFSKFSTTAGVSFVKSGEDYYLFFYQVRSYSSRYEIHTHNSFDIVFDDNQILSLYPCGDFRGKGVGVGINYAIGCYYNVSKEQLEQIADHMVEMVRIHITTDKEIGAAQVDEDGSLFLEYVIHKDNYSDNAPRMANCILSQ